MGEYAVDQMMHDFKRMTGIDADRSDFEDAPRKPRTRFRCATCGRIFRVPQAVADHQRDKHGALRSQP
jgi:hypothetical protein